MVEGDRMTEKETRFEIERLRLENEHLRVQLKKAESNKQLKWLSLTIVVIVLLVFSVNILPNPFMMLK